MNKEQKLKLLRGLKIKTNKLLVQTRDHYNAEGWDTEQNSKYAAHLLDEIIDLATLLRNELL
jgi:hypothetical protein